MQLPNVLKLLVMPTDILRVRHRLRTLILRAILATTRPQVSIATTAIVGRNPKFGRRREIRLGKNFFCGHSCHFGTPIVTGANVMLGSCVAFVGGDHTIDHVNVPMRFAPPMKRRMVTVGDDVWIGHGAIILHGVRIGSGAVVGAGSVVTKNVAANTVVAGNPSRVLRARVL